MSILFSTLVALVVATGPSEGLLSDPDAMKHFQAAQAAFNEGDYETASKELEKAFLIEPVDALLYPWAQAERFSGRCKIAIDLYEKFLATKPSENFRQAAEENLERCKKEIDEANAAAAAANSTDEEEDDTKVEPLDDGWDEVAQQEPETTDTKSKKPKKDRKWYQDPVGGVLSGVGLAGVAAGGALLGISYSRAGEVSDEDTNQDYVDARRSATNLRNGGAVAASVGGALLIAGIVRYALLATKDRRGKAGAKNSAARSTLGPWFDDRRAAGVTFVTRF